MIKMATEKKYCYDCGSPLRPDLPYCPNCGATLMDINDIIDLEEDDDALVSFPDDPSTDAFNTESIQDTSATAMNSLDAIYAESNKASDEGEILLRRKKDSVELDDILNKEPGSKTEELPTVEEEVEYAKPPVAKPAPVAAKANLEDSDEYDYDDDDDDYDEDDDYEEESRWPIILLIGLLLAALILGYMFFLRPLLNSGRNTASNTPTPTAEVTEEPEATEEATAEPTPEATEEPEATPEATEEPEATPEATPTPTPETTGKSLTIGNDEINIRNQPSTSGQVLGVARRGTKYTYTDTKEADGYTWYQIGEGQWIASNGQWVTLND